MSFFGLIHQFFYYGVLTNIWCLYTKKITLNLLISVAFKITNGRELFIAYLFWSTVLYLPYSFLAAWISANEGDGLLISSDNPIIMFFAHIIEETLGLILTPIWIVIYSLTRNWDEDRAVDVIIWIIQIILIVIGIISL